MNCVYCKIKLEFGGYNCGNNICFWKKCNEKDYKDNKVIDFINTKIYTAELLLMLASLSTNDALPQSSYKYLILKYDTREKANKFLTNLQEFKTDKEILDNINDTYYSLRFYLLSARCNFIIDFYTNSLECIKVKHSYADTSEFEMRLIETNQEDYLFHGSPIKNWHSILHNGLYNYSGTKKMANGQSYGPGIYLTDNINLSFQYAKSNKFIIGIYKIIGDMGSYKKTNDIFVIKDSKNVFLKYIIIGTNLNTVSDYINKRFSKKELTNKIIKESQSIIIKSSLSTKPNLGMKRLMKEYQNILQNGEKLGINVMITDDNICKWNVVLTNFDEKCLFYKDLELYTKDKCVYMEIHFQKYPFTPPFVNVIKPKFLPQTAHVTSGGSICTELLSSSGWSPVTSIENLLVQIKSLIIEGDGRLDPNAPRNFKYNFQDAQKSFQSVSRSHGWN